MPNSQALISQLRCQISFGFGYFKNKLSDEPVLAHVSVSDSKKKIFPKTLLSLMFMALHKNSWPRGSNLFYDEGCIEQNQVDLAWTFSGRSSGHSAFWIPIIILY